MTLKYKDLNNNGTSLKVLKDYMNIDKIIIIMNKINNESIKTSIYKKGEM